MVTDLSRLAILDVETTGGNPQRNEVIEVGIVLIDNGKVSQEWSTLVSPHQKLDAFITKLTGIQSSDLLTAPIFAEIAEELSALLHDRVLVAHNVRFDYAFLKTEFGRLGKTFELPQLCTVKLARNIFPKIGKYSLGFLAERLALPSLTKHRALSDAQSVWHLWQKMQSTVTEKQLQVVCQQLLKQSSVPRHLKPQVIASLPTTPGVYFFYDERDCLLYLGKSINIRGRVQSHFYNDVHSSKELHLAQQVSRIAYQETESELAALLLESKLVKELKPIYNHQLRAQESCWLVEVKADRWGYQTCRIVQKKNVKWGDLNGEEYVFKSKKAAQNALQKMAKEARLCLKLLGLEKNLSACFNYHLNNCSGACVQEETTASYNQRLFVALSPYQISKIDTSYFSLSDTFDLDAYKIITRQLDEN